MLIKQKDRKAYINAISKTYALSSVLFKNILKEKKKSFPKETFRVSFTVVHMPS